MISSRTPRRIAFAALITLGAMGLACNPQAAGPSTDEFAADTNGAGAAADDAQAETQNTGGDPDQPCYIGEDGVFYCDDGSDPNNGSPDDGDCGEDGCAGDSDNPDADLHNPGDGSGGGDDGNDGDCGEDGCDANSDTPSDAQNPLGDDVDYQPDCFSETFVPAANAEADLLLVVDRSGSMSEVPGGAALSKWDQVRSVVGNVAQDLDDSYGFGLMFYPAGATQTLQCVGGDVVVDIADNNGQAINDAFGATGPGGGTPTAATLQVAGAHLHNRLTSRPQAVVLATDGAPNCNAANDINTCVCSQTDNCTHAYACLDDIATVNAVSGLANDGVATFVIGIPGSELFADVLDAMATAGGTATNGARHYYDTSSASDLEQALRAIGQRVSQCRFELQSDPMSSSLSVRVNGQAVVRDPGRVDGWDYVGARTIEFFGPACQDLASAGAAVAVGYCSMPEG